MEPLLAFGGPALVNLALCLVGYGVLKAQVKQHSEALTNHRDQLQAIKETQANHRLDIHEHFVTLSAFRELRREMVESQTQANAKIDRLIEMVGKLHGRVE